MAMTFKDIIAEMLGGAYSGFVAKGVMDTMESKMKPYANPKNGKGVMDTTATLTPTAIDVMRGEDTFDYDFDVDGNTEGYTFSGDGNISLEDIQRMRDMQGITADGQMMPNTTNLGLGAGVRGFDTPAAREGAIAEANFLNNNFAGTGEANMDVDRQSFNTNFANLTPEQKAQVTEMMAGMTPEQKKAFALGMTGKKGAGRLGGYEVENYNRLRQGF